MNYYKFNKLLKIINSNTFPIKKFTNIIIIYKDSSNALKNLKIN